MLQHYLVIIANNYSPASINNVKEISVEVKTRCGTQQHQLYKVNHRINMKLVILVGVAYFCTCDNVAANNETKIAPDDQKFHILSPEDEHFLNETFAKYGQPYDYQKLDLPGPEFAKDSEKLKIQNELNRNGSDAISLKVRTITDYFSYNGRYEEIRIKKTNDREMPIIKGQFGEHFPRKSGGMYIRTVGYTLDENGFKEFLIDVSIANTKVITPSYFIISGTVKPISSTVLITLTGGNNIG